MDVTPADGPGETTVVLNYVGAVGVWAPTNGPSVCMRNLVPADIFAKACHGPYGEFQ